MEKIFISYSHDTISHNKKVKEFADFLVTKGIDVEFDQYTTEPKYGWAQYMVDNIQTLKYVLCICTEKYKKSLENKIPEGECKGAKFEGRLITDIIYEEEYNSKFIPIVLDESDIKNIPRVLHPDTYYVVNTKHGLLSLYAKLTNQSTSSKPRLGEILSLDKFRDEIKDFADKNKDHLENYYVKTYLSCLSKLKTNGVTEEIAKKIIDNDILSSDYDYLLEYNEPLTYFVGEFGSGKSYSLSILCLKLISEYNKRKILPIIFRANEFSDKQVENVLNKYTSTFDNIIILIDGLDEISYKNADNIIENLNCYLETFKNIRCIIASRPTFITNNKKNVISVKELNDFQLNNILNLVAKQDFTPGLESYLGKEFIKTIRNPFFALLYATSQLEEKNRFKKRSELIRNMVGKTLYKHIDKAGLEVDLQKIAAYYIDNEMQEIRINDIAHTVDLYKLIDTGYFFVKDEYISFNLPILAQWFASQAIRNRIKNINDVVARDSSIIKWRYPLSLLFNSMSFEESKEYMSRIVSTYPGVASMIISDGINIDCLNKLPDPIECGEKIFYCMGQWVQGIGLLSEEIAPVYQGQLCTLYVNTEDSMLQAAWANRYLGKKIKILECPFEQYVGVINKATSQTICNLSTWPWLVTLKYLKEELKEKIDKKILFCEKDSTLKNEYLWNVGRCLINKSSLFTDDIDISIFDQLLNIEPESLVCINKVTYKVQKIQESIKELKNDGENYVKYSTLKPDTNYQNSYIWSCYSEEQLFNKAKDVYTKAFNSLINLLQMKAFGNLNKNMKHAVTLPAKMVCNVLNEKDNYGPSISSYFLPLCKNKKSSIDFLYNAHQKSVDCLQTVVQETKKYRPSNYDWCLCSYQRGILDIFNELPITKVILSWIKEDLKSINWLD